MRELVREAWRETRWALGIGADDAALADLALRYSEPHRRYHDLSHLEACLGVLEPHRALAERIGEVLVAVFFHDAIYDPTRRDNESASATLARDVLSRSGAGEGAIERIAALIMATRDHDARGAGDAALVLDVDLSILGEDAATFDRYDHAIREEYAFVPDEAYRAGRRAVLEGFLSRPRIYQTAAIHAEREAVARANLRRAAARLA